MPKRTLLILKILDVFYGRLHEILEDFTKKEQISILDAFLEMTKHALEYEHNERHQMMLEEIYDDKLISKFKSQFVKADTYNLYYFFNIDYLVGYTNEEEELFMVKGVNLLNWGDLTEDEYYYLIDMLFYILTVERRELYLNSSPSQSDSEIEKRNKTKHITIDKKVIDLIIRILSIYFDEFDIKDLMDVLNGKTIDRKLVFLDNGNKLVDVFFVLKEKGKIRENKREIKEWICTNFQYRNNRKVIKDFNEGNVHKILTKQQSAKRRIKLPVFY